MFSISTPTGTSRIVLFKGASSQRQPISVETTIVTSVFTVIKTINKYINLKEYCQAKKHKILLLSYGG